MRKSNLVLLVAVSVASFFLGGCPPAPDVTMEVVFTPYAVPTAKGAMIVYELLLSDFRQAGLEMQKVEVYGDGALLRTYAQADLLSEDSTGPVVLTFPWPTKVEDDGGGGCLQPMLYFGFTLTPQETVPAALSHVVYFSKQGEKCDCLMSVSGGEATLSTEPLMVLDPPFRDTRMVATSVTVARSGHRRAIRMYDGKGYIAERFAIDWEKLTEGGTLSSGPATDLNTYPGYGIDVLAVAAGRIVKVVDGIPNNQTPPDLDITIDLSNIAGNEVVLQITEDRFALYGHLIPGSILVHEGDEVVAGQVLGRMGNSGNSDAPHIHFHVCDANMLFHAQGIPYVIRSFTYQGDFPYWTFPSSDTRAMVEQFAWTPLAEPSPRTNEFAYDGLVVETE